MAFDTFGGFKTSSFYGKKLNDKLFSPFSLHTSRIDQSNSTPSPKRSRSLSVDSRKTKKSRSSLFSGVKHGLKKPRKVEPKKFKNTDNIDKVLKSNKKRKHDDNEQWKENKAENAIAKTPVKQSKNSIKKSSSKKNTSRNFDENGFRYKFEKTPEQLKVTKVLPYTGFSRLPASIGKGKKKLFSPEDSDKLLHKTLPLKKVKLSSRNSPLKKNSPENLFNSNEIQKNISSTPKVNVLKNGIESPSSRSSKKAVCETIDLDESPIQTASVFDKSQFHSNAKCIRQSPRTSLKSKSSTNNCKTMIPSPRRTPRLSSKYNEPMHLDSPRTQNYPENPSVTSAYSSSVSHETPRLMRSSQKKVFLEQISPKRLLSSKKNLFPKEIQTSATDDYIVEDITANNFNVFDVLNDSLDGIELLEDGCNDLFKKSNVISPKRAIFAESMTIEDWDCSPETKNTHSKSVLYTFPKCAENVNSKKGQPLNTFPRSTRTSRKCVQRLTPNRRIYGSCKKTLKAVFDLSQLQLSSPTSELCPVCAYKGESDSEHLQIHSTFLRLKHYAWKNECVIDTYDEGKDRIICITANDKMWLEKVASVIEIADLELGFAESECSVHEHTKVYLYISKHVIVGLAVVNPLTKANRLISSSKNYSVDYASEEQYPATCGISRIWVLKTYRRKNIASRLMDAARNSFIPQKIIKIEELAFSVPTAEGKLLAQNYTRRKDFLIFTEIQ